MEPSAVNLGSTCISRVQPAPSGLNLRHPAVAPAEARVDAANGRAQLVDALAGLALGGGGHRQRQRCRRRRRSIRQGDASTTDQGLKSIVPCQLNLSRRVTPRTSSPDTTFRLNLSYVPPATLQETTNQRHAQGLKLG